MSDFSQGKFKARRIRHGRRRAVLCTAYPVEVVVYASTGKKRGKLLTVDAKFDEVHPYWKKKYRIIVERIDK